MKIQRWKQKKRRSNFHRRSHMRRKGRDPTAVKLIINRGWIIDVTLDRSRPCYFREIQLTLTRCDGAGRGGAWDGEEGGQRKNIISTDLARDIRTAWRKEAKRDGRANAGGDEKKESRIRGGNPEGAPKETWRPCRD